MPPKKVSDPHVHHLAQCITVHAWNADFSRLALCPNDNTVTIYKKTGNEWEVEHVLSEHDQVITGIDWAPKSNRIVTCSQDRNAYVWTFTNGAWKPTLVILRLNRAATSVRWSPKEDKFAVASGAKIVSVCYFEEENDWWVSKHIKKHKSTVLKVDWHPNNVLLITGSSDFKARVFSAYIKNVDKKIEAPLGFGPKLPFGDLLLELDSPAVGWVHSVTWSPSGDSVAFCGHDSTVSFCNLSQGRNVQCLKIGTLPLVDLLWVSENSVVGVGHEYAPYLFSCVDGTWSLVRKLEDKKKKETVEKKNAFAMFQDKVNTGTTNSNAAAKIDTKHQNCITCIRRLSSSGGRVQDFSTSGLDGNVVFWNLKELESSLSIQIA